VRYDEPVPVEMKIANLRVTHVDDAFAVTDIRACPQLTEALACSCQLVNQRAQPRIAHVATGDLA
jgi:hypothetical protein